MKKASLLTVALMPAMGLALHAEVLMSDGFDPNVPNPLNPRATIGSLVHGVAVQTGAGLTWQSDFTVGASTSPMNGFVFGRDTGLGRFLVPDSTRATANAYVPFVFSNIPKILTARADFGAADNKDATSGHWTLGFWQNTDNANLANITSGDAVTLRFFPVGTNEGRVQIRVRINGVLSTATAATAAPFAATDSIQLTLSYDTDTGETVATARNMTTGALLSSATITRPGIGWRR